MQTETLKPDPMIRTGLLTRARELLTEPTGPLLPYVLRAGLVSSLPVIASATLAFHLGWLTPASFPIPRWPLRDPQVALLMGVIDTLTLSPIVETGLALLPIWALRKIRVQEWLIPVLAGMFWGLVHARGGNWFALIQAWPFYCFTLVLMTHEKKSRDRAWMIASAVHGVNNLVALSVSASLATSA